LEVRREWNNIDILLIDDAHKFVVIIENKIDSGEHSQQLERYRGIIRHHFSNYQMLCLFLSPEGVLPTDENYIPVDYTKICNLLETIAVTRESTLGPDVRTLITHYTNMLRRHIMNESEIAELCRRIYQKHQRAIDLIVDHRPDLQSNIREILVALVDITPGCVLDYDSKSYCRFGLEEWDTPPLNEGLDWSSKGRIMLFQFENFPNSLNLKLIIGPGPNEIRKRLHQMAQENASLKAYRVLGKKWNTIFKRAFLTLKSFEEATIDDLEEEINKKWQTFVEKDLPPIKKIVKAQDWIWENE